MKGGIYTKERCPICNKNFSHAGDDLICLEHLTRPQRVQIKVYDRDNHKYIPVCSDPVDRGPLYLEKAKQILGMMRLEIQRNQGHIDASRYVAQKIRPLRFVNWSTEWLKRKAREAETGKRSPSYIKALRVYVRRYQAFFGEEDIRDIGPKRIEEFYLSLEDSPKYIKNIMDGLHKLFKDALRLEAVKKVPAFPEYKDVPEVEMDTIDLDLQDQLIESIDNRMDRAFILFTAREMVRPSETRALWWDDIDLKHDRVRIRRHFSLNEIRQATKAKQIKRLPLDGEVKRALESLPQHITSPFVFQRHGKPYGEAWARKVWRRYAEPLGIKTSLYTGTRHSSATEAADRVGVDATQEFLHHTNRRTTQRYVKQNPDRLKKVLRGG